MSGSPRNRSARGFLLGFLLVALAIAGGLSYLASNTPDGLDTVTLEGCSVSAAGEPIEGTCIAQNARDSATAGSPLADYTVAGAGATTGLAGVIGVVVCLMVAGGLFWMLRRRGPTPGTGPEG